MNRRRYLGSAASALGLAAAGCLDRGGSDADTGTDDDTTSDGTTFEGVEVGDATVTPELVAMNSPDSIGTFGERDEQFVLARAAATGDETPDRDEFALEAGGDTHDPTADIDGTRITQLWNVEDRGDVYEDGGAGWLVFRCPKPLGADGAAITWPGGEYTLGDEVTAELDRPTTRFEVVEFQSPETVGAGDSVSVSLTIRNADDADGTFVGGFNYAGMGADHAPETAVRLDVPAGETATWTYEYPVVQGDVIFILNSRSGRVTSETTVETE